MLPYPVTSSLAVVLPFNLYVEDAVSAPVAFLFFVPSMIAPVKSCSHWVEHSKSDEKQDDIRDSTLGCFSREKLQ